MKASRYSTISQLGVVFLDGLPWRALLFLTKASKTGADVEQERRRVSYSSFLLPAPPSPRQRRWLKAVQLGLTRSSSSRFSTGSLHVLSHPFPVFSSSLQLTASYPHPPTSLNADVAWP